MENTHEVELQNIQLISQNKSNNIKIQELESQLKNFIERDKNYEVELNQITFYKKLVEELNQKIEKRELEKNKVQKENRNTFQSQNFKDE